MQSLVHLVILLMLLAIVVSLGSALYHLSRGPGPGREDSSRKMVRALSIRVGLSLALFFLLMILWYAGLIAPHGLQPR